MTAAAPATRPVPPAARPARSSGAWTGARTLRRFALRRDRVRLASWAAAMYLTAWSCIVAVEHAYPDQAALEGRAALSQSPASVLIAGPLFTDGTVSFGAVLTNEISMLFLVLMAILSILTAVRHTRADEETGRTELLRALPVGRFAPAVAAVVAVVCTNVVVALAVFAGLMTDSPLPVEDTAAFASSVAVTGVAFGAIGALTAQVFSSARAASGGGMALLGAAFLVRAVGDVAEPATGSWLSWASPLAWAQQVRPFAGLRWWPLALVALLAVAASAAAGALAVRRDLGRGLRQDRPGPPRASAGLLRGWGLAWRLTRGTTAAWATGLFLFSAICGGLGYAVEDMVRSTPELLQWFGGDAHELLASFGAYALSLLAAGVIAFVVSVVLRFRAEENGGRIAPVIANGMSRTTLWGWWLVVAAAAALATLLLGGLGAGAGMAMATGEGHWVGELTAGALAFAPAVLAVLGAAAALVGALPRLAPLGWVVVGYVCAVTFLGDMFQLPDAVQKISPVALTPRVPLESAAAGPLQLLVAVTAAGVLVALAGFRRRDLLAG